MASSPVSLKWRLAFILIVMLSHTDLIAAQTAAPPSIFFNHFVVSTDGDGLPGGWTEASPRPEIAPGFSVVPGVGRDGQGVLALEGQGNPGVFGGWRRVVGKINGGKSYRFDAWYKAQGIPPAQERSAVTARIDWLDQDGQSAGPPSFLPDEETGGGWTRVGGNIIAPEKARRAAINLLLAWAPKGKVWWDQIRLTEQAPPAARPVRIMSVYCRPTNVKTPADAVALFCKLVEEAANEKPDLICLPELITMTGTGKSYADVAEPVPGPTTKRLGRAAREAHSYLVAGVCERDGPLVYNTAVLIDREGELLGKYRKTHLPREEAEGGITPGSSYPVFDVDFGRIGLLVCWDIQFPETARALAQKGAELLVLPIAGGNELLTKARAIENQVYLVSSSYDMKSFVLDPNGTVLGEATPQSPVAIVQIDLGHTFIDPWLGDMKTRTWKERRPDLSIPAR